MRAVKRSRKENERKEVKMSLTGQLWSAVSDVSNISGTKKKNLQRVKQDEERLRYKKNKLQEKNKCCGNLRKSRNSCGKRGKPRKTRTGMNSRNTSGHSGSDKMEGGQPRRKDLTTESKQRHKNKEHGTETGKIVPPRQWS